MFECRTRGKNISVCGDKYIPPTFRIDPCLSQLFSEAKSLVHYIHTVCKPKKKSLNI